MSISAPRSAVTRGFAAAGRRGAVGACLGQGGLRPRILVFRGGPWPFPPPLQAASSPHLAAQGPVVAVMVTPAPAMPRHSPGKAVSVLGSLAAASLVTRSPEPFTTHPPLAGLGCFSEGSWGWAPPLPTGNFSNPPLIFSCTNSLHVRRNIIKRICYLKTL